MLKSKPAPRHSGRRAIQLQSGITQSIRAGKNPPRYGWPDYENAGTSQRPPVLPLGFSCTITTSSNFALRSHPDSLYLPYREAELPRNLRITRSSGEAFQRLLTSLRSSVNELRCFNGFRLASGVGVTTSTGRSGLTVDAISTAAAAVMNASAARASELRCSIERLRLQCLGAQPRTLLNRVVEDVCHSFRVGRRFAGAVVPPS
jgi:hypothetical protein